MHERKRQGERERKKETERKRDRQTARQTDDTLYCLSHLEYNFSAFGNVKHSWKRLNVSLSDIIYPDKNHATTKHDETRHHRPHRNCP